MQRSLKRKPVLSEKFHLCAIVIRVDVDGRLMIVEMKNRLGDLEIDLAVGKGHKGAFDYK